jgi:murein DD-endopeptidase MepM/ murein hydrolase activator NlpD
MNPILTLPCLRIHPVLVALLLASGCSSEGTAVKEQPAAAASSAVAAVASAPPAAPLATGVDAADSGPTSADPGRLVVEGKLAQGSLVFAKITGKVAKIKFPGHRTVVNDDGSLPIAFYLHAPKTETMEIHFADGSVLDHVFTVEARTFKTEEIDNLPKSSVKLDPKTQVAHAATEARIEAVRMKSSAKICYEDGFTWPVVGRITSPYGDTRRSCGVDTGIHMGVDIGVPAGTPVKAPACGTVVFAEAGDPVNGTTLVLDHGRGVTTTYLHLTDFKAKVGDEVKRGDVLATSGKTGRSTGPHLHWGMNYFELRLDPELIASPMPAK